MAKTTKEILAAGSVVFRRGADGQREVLLVHRPRYDDWSLPKGKLAADEYLAGCAARETWEETAARVRLGVPVDVSGDEIALAEQPAVATLLLALGVAARGGRPEADEARQLLASPLAQPLTTIWPGLL